MIHSTTDPLPDSNGFIQAPLLGEPLRLIATPPPNDAPEDDLGVNFLANYDPEYGTLLVHKYTSLFLISRLPKHSDGVGTSP